MGVTISSHVLTTIIDDAEKSRGIEVCGLLYGTPAVIAAAAACRNVAADPATAFEIDPAMLIAAYRRARGGGPAVVGHYHSHPTGIAVPSPRDAAQALGDGALWLIAAAGDCRAWRSVEPGRFVEESLDAV